MITSFEYNAFENVTNVETGGFGEVKRAYEKALGKDVALKCLFNTDNDSFYEEFMNEVNK